MRIYLGGGMTANQYLKKLFDCTSLEVHIPSHDLAQDNGAMIAGLGYHLYQENGPSPIDLEVTPRIPLST